MTKSDYFFVGCKLLGVYCLYLSVTNLAPVLATFIEPGGSFGEMDKVYTFMVLAIRIIPIIYLVLGIYLIKDGHLLQKFAYQTEDVNQNLSTNEDKFILFLKMLGVYLIVINYPDFLRSIVNYSIYKTGPSIYNFTNEQNASYLNFFPSLLGLIFGFYLLRSGEFFVNLARKGTTKS